MTPRTTTVAIVHMSEPEKSALRRLAAARKLTISKTIRALINDAVCRRSNHVSNK